jgi:hypothetical protein
LWRHAVVLFVVIVLCTALPALAPI